PNNIEGLMHNTILAQEQGKKAEEFFTVGQKAQFRIVNINKEERKLALSTLLEEKKQEPKSVEPKKAEFKREASSSFAKPAADKSADKQASSFAKTSEDRQSKQSKPAV